MTLLFVIVAGQFEAMEDTIKSFKNQVYQELRCKHDSTNLFKDLEFPTNSQSLHNKHRISGDVIWKRPHEICDNPKFIVESATRFDLHQGALGDCWFVAAVSILSERKEEFNRVVPTHQTFKKRGNYNGLFHFRFWQSGEWYDVVVDDFLPVFKKNTELVYCRNKREPNEFWSCLLEKAYAKLFGSYEGLNGGHTIDGLIDMTGGIEESYELKQISLKQKSLFFNKLKNDLDNNSMISCSTSIDETNKDGLVDKHAYAMNALKCFKTVDGKSVSLVRCRNPWGRFEWKGKWSDEDKDSWNQVPLKIMKELYKYEDEGEFWISFEDWITKFDRVQICNIKPEAFKISPGQKVKRSNQTKWTSLQFNGEWLDKSAVGSKEKFWLDPQYLIKLYSPQISNPSEEYNLIITCMQKDSRLKRARSNGLEGEEFIKISIYRLKENQNLQSSKIAKIHQNDLDLVGTSGSYTKKREVTFDQKITAGNYVIIPSILDEKKAAEFLIRIFTQLKVELIVPNKDIMYQSSNRLDNDLSSQPVSKRLRSSCMTSEKLITSSKRFKS